MNNLLTNTRAMAQDARSTQSYSNPLRLNPSIMGANTDMRFILGYRSQWNAIEKGYTTTSFTAMCPFFVSNGKGKLDVGLSAYSDKAGAFKTSDFALAIGYSKELAPNNTLCLTLLGGYAQKSLNTGALTYDNQYVLGSYNSTNLSKETTIIEKVGYADVGFGLMWIMNPSIDKSRLIWLVQMIP